MQKSELIEKLSEIEGEFEVFVEGVRGSLDPLYTVCPQKYNPRQRVMRRENGFYPLPEDCIVLA